LDDLVASIRKRAIFDKDMFNGRSPFTGNQPEHSAFTAPGYPLVLGLTAKAFGDDEAGYEAFTGAVRWGQCVLGALTAGLYFLFARRAFGSRFVATLSGIFCALYPFWVIDTATLDDGVLATFLLAAALFFGVRASQSSAALSSLLYGLALVALALVRAALLPFAAVALLWFLLRCRTIAQGWLCALLGFLGFVIGFTPWVVYNWQRFHEVVPVVDSTYAALWAGNHRDATGGPAGPLDWARIRFESDLAHLTRRQRDAVFEDRIAAELQRDQVEAVRHRLNAGLFFFFGQRWFEDGQLADAVDPERAPEWLTRAYPGALAGSLLAVLVLGVLGWRWSYGWRFSAMPSSLAVMWIPLPYVLGHAEQLSGPRLPLDGVLLTYVAFVVGCCVPGVSRWLLAGERLVAREAVAVGGAPVPQRARVVR
jgi:hypothetical protein